MYKLKEFNKIIKEVCDELNIVYTELSDDWIIKLQKDGKIRFIVGYRFDLNTQAISEVCNDKHALYSVLKSENIPVVESKIVFKNEEYKLKELYNLYNGDIVLKPNNGTCGNNVIHIKDLEELEYEYKRLINQSYSVDICPFYDIQNEYRAIFLQNKKYIYKKVKPVIIGDGIHSVKELLIMFNSSFYCNADNFNNKDIDLQYIPKKEEKIEYEWRFNLSKGAKIEEINEQEKSIINNIVDEITDLFNLKFVSIDVIKTKDNEFFVMEINSGVMTENLIRQKEYGRKMAKEIYKEAIIQMFN